MKQRTFTFLLIALVAVITACKKNRVDPDIREYDEQQIKAYLSTNGLTGFTRDAEGFNDTSGIYYKILQPGTGDRIQYSDQISVVYTIKSFDGKYNSTDTITNHLFDYAGLLSDPTRNLPKGLQLGIHNLLQYKGGSIRLMIPSHLAYGVNGIGTGSVTNVNTRIAGNQSLDYYVHVIDDQDAYDDKVIKNYMDAKGLTGYTKDPFGYWYKIVTPGTGAAGEIKAYSKVSNTYVGTLLNGAVFDESAKTTATVFIPGTLTVTAYGDALIKHAVTGTSLSLFIPSSIAYGTAAQTGIPLNSILHFEIQVTKVEQP